MHHAWVVVQDFWVQNRESIGGFAMLMTFFIMGYGMGKENCRRNTDKIAERIAKRIKKEGIEILSETDFKMIKKFDTEDHKGATH